HPDPHLLHDVLLRSCPPRPSYRLRRSIAVPAVLSIILRKASASLRVSGQIFHQGSSHMCINRRIGCRYLDVVDDCSVTTLQTLSESCSNQGDRRRNVPAYLKPVGEE